MRVLVIDDEPPVAALIAEGLRLEGHEVLVATSGQEGLRLIEQGPPDVVFLDLGMPGMDGTEVLRRIRAGHRDLPVVIFSGWGTEQQVAAARELGVTDVLQKPTPLKNLTQTLARLQQDAVAETAPYLVVVSHQQPDVHEKLLRALAGNAEFHVLLDRRHRERRQRQEPHEPDRRRADRRIKGDDFLRAHGIGVIRRRQAGFRPPR